MRVRSLKGFSLARVESIPIRQLFRMFTRIYSTKALIPERASTTSMRLNWRWPGKCPRIRSLSHDLFEGIFARVALATDIELFDEFPSRYEAVAARQHRWARGDWQLLPFLFGRGRSRAGKRIPFTIPAIGRWKILDNLRRTLSAPTAFLTLMVGWLLSPASPWLWTGFILATVAIPALLPFFIGLYPASERHFEEKPFSRRAQRSGARRIPGRLDTHIPRISGVADVRRDSPDPDPSLYNPQEFA